MEKKLDLCIEPAAFFQEKITEAMSRQRFSTIEVAEYYLVDLLRRFMLASNLFDKSDEERGSDRDPLAVLFLNAQKPGVESGEKVRLLRKLGDTSLYISGFFGDSLNRKVVDLDYYRQMGCIAYRSLSEAVRDDQFHELYAELSDKFTGFVDVLTEVSQEAFVQQHGQNLLRVYDMYVRTGSEAAKKQLESQGLPTPLVIQNNPDTTKKTKN